MHNFQNFKKMDFTQNSTIFSAEIGDRLFIKLRQLQLALSIELFNSDLAGSFRKSEKDSKKQSKIKKFTFPITINFSLLKHWENFLCRQNFHGLIFRWNP